MARFVIPCISGSTSGELGGQNIEDLNIGVEDRGSQWIRVESREVVKRDLPDGSHTPAVQGSVWPESTVMVWPEGTARRQPRTLLLLYT